MSYNPARQAEAISEAYSQDKRPLGLLLTAGCPLSISVGDSALIPDIAGLTRAVSASLPEPSKTRLSTVVALLAADGVVNPNIEHALTLIRSLRDVAGNAIVRGFTAADLDALDAAIAAKIVEIANVQLPVATTPFDELAQWIASIDRAFAVELFTTNYDLLIEYALERHQVPFFDGFVGSTRAYFDQRAMDDDAIPARWARLWKLHGSINWKFDAPSKSVVRLGTVETSCPLIHPSHLKYAESRRMPYLSMIDRLRAFLRQPSAVLIVSGYSFGDQHVNEALAQGADLNSSAAVFALQYGALAKYPAAIEISTRISNITVLANDQAVIGTTQAEWADPEGSIDATSFWNATGNGKGEFTLGDFKALGSFLAALVVRRGAH